LRAGNKINFTAGDIQIPVSSHYMHSYSKFLKMFTNISHTHTHTHTHTRVIYSDNE